ncbi:MAG: beta-propeller fold lactonase family protein, partial [Bacteroidetes bacterium]|nr:beta-propeller fold lactonase family protein [Bacteroidota bacterium]
IVLPMPDGKSVWVTSEGDNKIVKINLDSMKVVAEIPVFNFPRVMTATPDGKFIYLTLRWFHGLVKLDAEQNKIITQVLLPQSDKFDSEGKAAHGLCVSPDGKTVYLTSQFTNDVTAIDVATDKILKNITVGKNPNWIEFTSDGKFAIVSNTSSHDASIIDIDKWVVTATIPVGKNPKRLWVADTK